MRSHLAQHRRHVAIGQKTATAVALGFSLTVNDLHTTTRAVVEDSALDAGGPITVELLKEPQPIVDFTLTALDGRRLSSADWRGKVVVLNFWATWCGPCRAEIPDLVALQNKYGEQLVVVGISEDEGPVDVVRKFAADYKVNYPVAMTTPEMTKVTPLT